MKILVVGSGGYIGESFAKYAQKRFSVDIVDSFEEWKNHEFVDYACVVFAAGIAHRKQSKKNAHEYFAVNRDIAVAVAQKAKTANVPQFVYLSSMAVFGKKEGEISANTKPNPSHNNAYGTSKFDAENALSNLQTADFKILILRPPMVYGENCPGKFRTLSKIANWLPLVPCNENKRSVLYIDNLSEFLCTAIAEKTQGTCHPQDEKHLSTSSLVRLIRRENGKKTRVFRAKFLLRILSVFPPIRIAFASLYYSKELK